jgi:membrane protease YdiL (CAAX protease family)
MILTQFESLVLTTITVMLMGLIVGSIIEWTRWRARFASASKARCTLSRPLATIGLIDILVAMALLIFLFSVAASAWRMIGPALGTIEHPSKVESNLAVLSAIRYQEPEIPETEPKPTEVADDEASPSSSPSSSTPAKPKRITQNQFLYSGFAMSAQLLCVFLVTLFIRQRTGCTFQQIGWRTDRFLSDMLVGWKCFLMMTPIVLVLNGVLQGLTKTSYEHPVQEMIKQYPWLLGIAYWQASIVAPISEEFGFRALLIGWFESIQFGRDKWKALVFGTKSLGQNEVNSSELESVTSPSDPNRFDSNIATLHKLAPASEVATEMLSVSAYRPPWWPAILSGTLFGLAHFNFGISWISLVLFGVVLGRLYQWRQSMVPVIMVHFLFNAMNVTLLGLSLQLPSKLGN